MPMNVLIMTVEVPTNNKISLAYQKQAMTKLVQLSLAEDEGTYVANLRLDPKAAYSLGAAMMRTAVECDPFVDGTPTTSGPQAGGKPS